MKLRNGTLLCSGRLNWVMHETESRNVEQRLELVGINFDQIEGPFVTF